ncbi:hypothetical protein [Mucilaginibacter sp. KACC 22063]|uniref:hypothetical protein n=1 Tax=Mucilaginibacter sp. KACC 22063 TaxID=3025666 RepID=UPI00236723D8|nr:hypothetical protein [Mucilaginibacter sp. KACC 22063]WDF56081.1 hypothetical protein PQ461_03275 [Mucilaginibacter sp. KACC 22063]
MKRFPYLIILVTIIGFSSCNGPNKSSDSDTVIIDTTTSKLGIDTTLTDTNSAQKSELDDKLSALKQFDVDEKAWNKLYSSMHKRNDEFSSSIRLSDPTSPKYVNRNGIYCEVEKSADGADLYFAIQYYADDWLFIDNAIFNLDGENSTYTPTEFKRDNGDGMIWEWSEERVEDWAMLSKLATAKKAKVKFIGQQYYKIVRITPQQQKAIRNMLTLYNGFLKGYKK